MNYKLLKIEEREGFFGKMTVQVFMVEGEVIEFCSNSEITKNQIVRKYLIKKLDINIQDKACSQGSEYFIKDKFVFRFSNHKNLNMEYSFFYVNNLYKIININENNIEIEDLNEIQEFILENKDIEGFNQINIGF